MQISEYANYVNASTEEIAKAIDNEFTRQRELIRVKVIREVRNYIEPLPAHYEWVIPVYSYDRTGRLEEKGKISLEQTINNFLYDEYTGNRIPTYESGRGWNYQLYEDELHYFSMDIAAEIMYQTIQRCIEEKYSVALTRDEFTTVLEACSMFNEIYDNCMASDFFFPEYVIDYLGIKDLKLRQIIKV